MCEEKELRSNLDLKFAAKKMSFLKNKFGIVKRVCIK